MLDAEDCRLGRSRAARGKETGNGADQIWWCENCGYEVGASGSCHACAKPLPLSPISQLTVHVPNEEVGYRLEPRTS